MPTGAASTQKKILMAAERTFLRLGFAGTSMDVIAQDAVVSKQTVYAHFKSKEALFIAVVSLMTDTASHAIGEDADDIFGDQPAAEYLLAVANAQLAAVITPRLMQLRRLIIGEVERFPALGQLLHANGPARSIARISQVLAHFVMAGELVIDDVDQAASHFNWLVMGAPLNAAMLLGDAGMAGGAELRAHAAGAVQVFLRAYAAAPGNARQA